MKQRIQPAPTEGTAEFVPPVSAVSSCSNFIIPYPGLSDHGAREVITKEIITFMRKLDVKAIHGRAMDSSEFGLSAFAAVIGLSAGPKAVAAIQEQGIALLLAGAVVTVVPLLAALYFGRFVLKLNPVVLLGALCGGQTVAAALSAVNGETESMTPVLGFTVTYAISNVLLAVWGPVIGAFT